MNSVKPDIRVIGFDDAPFTWDDERVPVVGAVTRGAAFLEALVRTDVAVDGDDATARLADAVASCRQRPDLKAVLLDGAALGGFNVVDVEALHEATGLPVMTVTKGAPDWDGMRAALEKHHGDWERRWRLLSGVRPVALSLPGRQPRAGDLHVRAVGVERDEARDLLLRVTREGILPEPLRIAHMAASLLR